MPKLQELDLGLKKMTCLFGEKKPEVIELHTQESIQTEKKKKKWLRVNIRSWYTQANKDEKNVGNKYPRKKNTSRSQILLQKPHQRIDC